MNWERTSLVDVDGYRERAGKIDPSEGGNDGEWERFRQNRSLRR